MTTPTPPTAEELAAKAKAEQDQELRLLATEINKPALSFEPATIRKAIVTAISAASTPPTISVQMSGDTSTTIDGVRIEETYSPRIGHTVLIFKQGADIIAFGHVADLTGVGAGGWITAGLTSGWAHNGNNNGTLQYRRVLDNGSWKMQWRGGVTVGSGVQVLATPLDAEYRPASRRTMLVPRDAAGGSNEVKVDFNGDGNVTLVGTTTAPYASGSTSSAGSYGGYTNTGGPGGTGSTDPFDETTVHPDGHSHGVVGSHSHSVSSHDHYFSFGSHSHSATVNVSVDAPTWVAFNVEYFL
ncbi:hypothetical protein C6N75_10030 [Streptomyces solincola]|uniref:Uncharacterized protein n=1 Tax=Streptomyces solincola TaxID=2100817 RepID=A0A2S9PYC5_9ACTN|nr:hypothetical protein [Streptomyces solincola]PRH79412.1 hypothetical protein C6N75_10030 [Streptomyces solincola]